MRLRREIRESDRGDSVHDGPWAHTSETWLLDAVWHDGEPCCGISGSVHQHSRWHMPLQWGNRPPNPYVPAGTVRVCPICGQRWVAAPWPGFACEVWWKVAPEPIKGELVTVFGEPMRAGGSGGTAEPTKGEHE